MAEKRGGTGKLKYDFPTQAALLIKTASGIWIQTTELTFRSWNGERKYSIPAETTLGKTDVEMKEIPYNGPVYLYGTNTEVTPTGEPTLATA